MRHCPECGTGISSSRLSCPACHQLLHKTELERLAQEAARASEASDLRLEIQAWRRALERLPPECGQHRSIAEKVSGLSLRLEQEGEPADNPSTGVSQEAGRSGGRWRWAGVGAAGLLAWKLKAVLVFVATKGKLLLLGGEGLLVLVGLAAAFRAWGSDAPEEGDSTAFVEFLLLVVAFSGLCLLPVPV